MGILTYFAVKTSTPQASPPASSQLEVPAEPPLSVVPASTDVLKSKESTKSPEQSGPPAGTPAAPKPEESAKPAGTPGAHKPEESAKPPVTRRISLRPFSAAPKNEHKPVLSEVQEHEKKVGAANAFAKRLAKPLSANPEKRAEESAKILRTLIVGPPSNTDAPRKATKPVGKPQLSKVKSELMQTTSANKVIAQLRVLPVSDEEGASKSPSAPIHAVCLAHPDAEEHKLRFAKFTPTGGEESSKIAASVASTSINTLADTFADMRIVSLIGGPDFGLGQPGDGNGILAGAVPTAETILSGIEQLTPQLMALGYATGRAVLPDHKGVHPPTDRLSVLTYWWGLELVLPPPSLRYLENAHSIQGSLLNFLTALSVLNNGVREILPFIRYMAQFVDFEFSVIKKQDRGQGVVCAATWIMPAALVPRPWDFPPPDPVDAGGPDAETRPYGTTAVPDPAASVPLPMTPPSGTPLSSPALKSSSTPPVAPPSTPPMARNVVSPGIALS